MLSEAVPTVVPTHGGAFDLTVCQRLARLAHSLSNSALRLFIHLWDLQLRDLSQGMFISTRDLAALSGLDPKSVRAALDQLYSRRAIVLRWGDSSRPNRIYVCLWQGEVVEVGGGKIPSPPPNSGPRVGEKFPHVGEKFPHPAPQNQACLYAHADGRLDSDIDPISDNRSNPQAEPPSQPGPHLVTAPAPIVEKVLSAQPDQFGAYQLHQAAALLHEAMRRRGDRTMQPPDNVVTAQFLACGEWPELQRLIMRIIQTSGGRIRKYGYFVTAALEQLHGIKPGELHDHRSGRRPQLVQPLPRPVPAAAAPPPDPPTAAAIDAARAEFDTYLARECGLSEAQIGVYHQLAAAEPEVTGGIFLRHLDEARKHR